VTFYGQLLRTTGPGLEGARVKLFVVPSDMVEQNAAICSPEGALTNSEGRFQIVCNLPS